MSTSEAITYARLHLEQALLELKRSAKYLDVALTRISDVDAEEEYRWMTMDANKRMRRINHTMIEFMEKVVSKVPPP